MTADAHLHTDEPGRVLGELCEQLEQRAKAKQGIRVECTATEGIVDVGWARCEMHVDGAALMLRAESADEAGLRQLCELLSRHLEHATGTRPGWSGGGTAFADTHAERRDTMRAFHRRMRH